MEEASTGHKLFVPIGRGEGRSNFTPRFHRVEVFPPLSFRTGNVCPDGRRAFERSRIRGVCLKGLLGVRSGGRLRG
jgi:hypothetical protein